MGGLSEYFFLSFSPESRFVNWENWNNNFTANPDNNEFIEIPDDTEEVLTFDSEMTVLNNEGVALEELSENPSAYLGKTVYITGEVDDRIGNNAFSLETPDPTDQNILVISRTPIIAQGAAAEDFYLFEEDTVLDVRGEVMILVIVRFNDLYGMDLTTSELAAFEGWPVVVTDSFEVIATE